MELYGWHLLPFRNNLKSVVARVTRRRQRHLALVQIDGDAWGRPSEVATVRGAGGWAKNISQWAVRNYDLWVRRQGRWDVGNHSTRHERNTSLGARSDDLRVRRHTVALTCGRLLYFVFRALPEAQEEQRSNIIVVSFRCPIRSWDVTKDEGLNGDGKLDFAIASEPLTSSIVICVAIS